MLLPKLPRASIPCCWISPHIHGLLLDFPAHLRPAWTTPHYSGLLDYLVTPWSTSFRPAELTLSCYALVLTTTFALFHLWHPCSTVVALEALLALYALMVLEAHVALEAGR